MALRAQVSLIFQDEDLYYNFVEQLKQTKQLQSTIIKCLSAYYRNPEVTALIDGYGEEELEQDSGVVVKESQDIIDEIRNTLAMQSYLSQELENTVEGGVQDVSDILNNATNLAEDKGLATSTNTDFGDGIPRSISKLEKINSEGQQKMSAAQSSATIPTDGSQNEVIARMFNQLDSMSNLIANLTERMDLMERERGIVSDNGSVAQNSQSSSQSGEVLTNNTDANQNSNSAEVADDISDFAEESIDEDIVAPPEGANNNDDATDFMLGLLDSM